jgi:hypothetical protein
MDLAAFFRPMEKYLRVHTFTAGFVHIELGTGNLAWGKNDLHPLMKKYAEKYLALEGFFEQAIGVLDPEPDKDVKTVLDNILLL